MIITTMKTNREGACAPFDEVVDNSASGMDSALFVAHIICSVSNYISNKVWYFTITNCQLPITINKSIYISV